jgi:hypothetical protein
MQTLPQLVAVVGVLVTGKLDAVPETIGSLHHGLLDACIPKYIRSVPQKYQTWKVVLEVRS